MSDNTFNEELNQDLSVEQPDNQEENTHNQDTINTNSEVETLKEQLKKEKDQFLRLFAEFDNFKKRTAKERLDIFKTANAEVITALIPVLDDFERAIKNLGASEEEQIKGIQLIYNKLSETLRSKGLKPMDLNPGDDFDSETQEAITQIPAPSDDLKGKIVDVIETGYTLNDKIIRYAKVVVGQ